MQNSTASGIHVYSLEPTRLQSVTDCKCAKFHFIIHITRRFYSSTLCCNIRSQMPLFIQFYTCFLYVILSVSFSLNDSSNQQLLILFVGWECSLYVKTYFIVSISMFAQWKKIRIQKHISHRVRENIKSFYLMED